MLSTTERLIIIIIGACGILLNSLAWGKISVPGHNGDNSRCLNFGLVKIFSFPGVKYAQMSAAPTFWGVDYGWALFSSLYFSALP